MDKTFTDTLIEYQQSYDMNADKWVWYLAAMGIYTNWVLVV